MTYPLYPTKARKTLDKRSFVGGLLAGLAAPSFMIVPMAVNRSKLATVDGAWNAVGQQIETSIGRVGNELGVGRRRTQA